MRSLGTLRRAGTFEWEEDEKHVPEQSDCVLARSRGSHLLAEPKKKAGFQRLALVTEVPNAERVAADSIYVSEAK